MTEEVGKGGRGGAARRRKSKEGRADPHITGGISPEKVARLQDGTGCC